MLNMSIQRLQIARPIRVSRVSSTNTKFYYPNFVFFAKARLSFPLIIHAPLSLSYCTRGLSLPELFDQAFYRQRH